MRAPIKNGGKYFPWRCIKYMYCLILFFFFLRCKSLVFFFIYLLKKKKEKQKSQYICQFCNQCIKGQWHSGSYLEIQFWCYSHIKVHIQFIMVGYKRSRCGTTWDCVHHRSFHLEITEKGNAWDTMRNFIFVWFGLNVAFNNLSVISRRCLGVTGSWMLTFRELPHWNITPQTLWHDIPPSHIILTLSWPVLALLS